MKTSKHGAGSGLGGKDLFRRLAHRTSDSVGRPWAFSCALLLIGLWLITGPLFNYSDTWQLVINTTTTVITFLVVFLIQNTQNRDSKAVHLKLDELLRGVKGARTSLVDLEEMTDDELEALQLEFHEMHERLKNHREHRARHRRNHNHGHNHQR